jgi:hypothetical protein
VGVETAVGSGEFRVDERLRVEEVRQHSDQAISTARVEVRLDDAFDSEEARRRYHPDLRIAIMTDEADASGRRMLFEGFAPVLISRWDGRIGRAGESFAFEAEHVFERLSRSRDSLVYGRRVRTGAIDDGLLSTPADFAGQSELVTALPCIFNPDGRPNRAAAPLIVKSPAGEARSVHAFTWDGGRRASKWTCATALRYLLWFYLSREGPVFEGNLFAVTDDLAAGRPCSSDPLTLALQQEPVSLACEATNLAEALSLLASAAGIHITAETTNAAGRPVTALRAWCAGGGPLRCLYLARGGRFADGTPRYPAGNRSSAEILAANNTHHGQAAWDHRGVIDVPVVIGDVKRYEMTLPLCPGWIPRDGLDNVALAGRAAAKAMALTPEQVRALGDRAETSFYFRRYHRHGSEFKLDNDTGRLWVLNEDGYYDAALYNRNAPFNNYRPFDFSTVADATVTSPGEWMRRPRRLLPPISRSSDGRRLGVWVEISFNSGQVWQQQSSGVRVLEDRAGIYFECDNPAEIAPAGADPAVQNMWYAIIEGTFRVRATAVIESDERLTGEFPPDRLATVTQQLNGVVIRKPRSYQFVSRRHTQNVLAAVTVTDGERDDWTGITAWAERLARAGQERRVSALPAIPWIETGYALGDRICEIRGRHVRFNTTAGSEARFPAVLERRFVLRDGAYETELVIG